MLVGLPAGRTLTLLDGSATAQDAYGNDVASWAETVVSGCTWWPSSTTESETVGGNTASSRYEALIPETTVHAGTGRPPSSLDLVRLEDGSVWQVDGHPRQHVSAITGAAGGLRM